jgi:lactoylglutathione lyase
MELVKDDKEVNMKIEHIAIWAKDIEKLRTFYEKYFHVKSSDKYITSLKKFSSYFLSYELGARLEIMQMDSVGKSNTEPTSNYFGYAHLAISVGTEEKVDQLTEKLKEDGCQVLDGPRKTGDGYYESAVLDPEGNKLEITI